jgi:hypothetical protein
MRKKNLRKHEEPQLPGEPVIISLDSVRQANARPDDHPPEPTNGNDHKGGESFWAGRNLAMRRSARWVA